MPDVLVIDDDADIRSLLEVALSLDGHDVVSAPAGAPGIGALREAVASGRRPVVILDVQMPDLDGWQVLEAIRRAGDLDGIPVVLCTVRASPEDLHRGWLAGCDAYLSKPFDLATVSREVTELAAAGAQDLARHRAARRSQLPS